MKTVLLLLVFSAIAMAQDGPRQDCPSGWKNLGKKVLGTETGFTVRNGTLSKATMEDLRTVEPPLPLQNLQNIEIFDFDSRIASLGSAVRRSRDGKVLLWNYGLGDVRITRNEEFENNLIRQANVFGNPTEPLRFRSYDKNGELHESAVFLGGSSRSAVDEDYLFQKLANDFADQLLAKDPNGEQMALEINHVHPLQEVRVGDRVVGRMLTHIDIETAQRLSEHNGGVPVIVRAISPNGYTYSAVFSGRRNITAEVAR